MVAGYKVQLDSYVTQMLGPGLGARRYTSAEIQSKKWVGAQGPLLLLLSAAPGAQPRVKQNKTGTEPGRKSDPDPFYNKSIKSTQPFVRHLTADGFFFFSRVSNEAHVTLHLSYEGGLAVTLGQMNDVWAHSCRQDPWRMTVNMLSSDLLRSNPYVFSNSAHSLIPVAV